MQEGHNPGGEPPSTLPDSIPDFKRGRFRGLLVFLAVLLLGCAAAFALSGVFESKRSESKKRPAVVESNEDPDNKEGGCPCNCDRSEAMEAEVRALGGEGALAAIDKSLTTITEREEAGYITEAMISHRLRLLVLERQMFQAGTIPAPLHPRTLPLNNLEHRARRPELRALEGERLRGGMELVVHGQTIERLANRKKLQLACFVLSIELENSSDVERVVKQPRIVADVPFPISRWYLRGDNGQPWDGKLEGHERKLVQVIGYLGEPISPKTRVDAAIHFESATLHATTWARARWNQLEPTHAAL